MKSEFDYYYGAEAEQFSFVKIPKVLFSDKKHFGKLSIGAKLMYGLLLDRMSLSRKNNWFDNQNRVYIVFPIEDIKEQLGICGETAVKLLKELDDENGIGLIKKKRRGQGMTSIIYVMNFIVEDDEQPGADTPEEAPETQEIPVEIEQNSRIREIRNQEFGKTEFKKSDNPNSRNRKNRTLEFGKTECNNTKENNTEKSNYKSNHIVSADEKNRTENSDFDMKSVRDTYEEIIKENIDYDYLVAVEWVKKDEIDELVTLIVDTVSYDCKTVRIGGREVPYPEVKSRFLKLTRSHIEYVLESLGKNSTSIKDTYRYNLTALFNAPVTMSNYYRAQVNHDMYGVSNLS